jgi:hypothetical protein
MLEAPSFATRSSGCIASARVRGPEGPYKWDARFTDSPSMCTNGSPAGARLVRAARRPRRVDPPRRRRRRSRPSRGTHREGLADVGDRARRDDDATVARGASTRDLQRRPVLAAAFAGVVMQTGKVDRVDAPLRAAERASNRIAPERRSSPTKTRPANCRGRSACCRPATPGSPGISPTRSRSRSGRSTSLRPTTTCRAAARRSQPRV